MEPIEHEQYEYARRRIKQKKHLYFHFVVFFVISIFLFLVNKWMKIGEPENWYIWVSTAWFFLFILHFIRVFVTDSFMNKKWERMQIDKLVALQQKKLQELQSRVADESFK